MDATYHDAIVHIKEDIEKIVKNNDNIEIEFRLGFKQNDRFNTDVGKTFFNKMISKLSESNLEKNDEKIEDYFYKDKRLSVIKNKSICIKKTKLAVYDFTFKGTAFDIRVSISTENPCNRFQQDKAEYKRLKERTSFKHKNWSYDFTTITVIENTIENKSYEVELEAIEVDFTKYSPYYFCHDAFLKLTDLIKLCDPIEDDPKLILIN